MLPSELQAAQQALMAGDKARARELLKPILATNPTADGWFLEASAAEDPQGMAYALAQALTVDPEHAPSLQSWQNIEPMLRQQNPQYAEQLNGQIANARSRHDAEKAERSKAGASAVAVERREGNQRIEVEGVYEMLWDCKFCGTEKLLAKTHKFCAVCGAAQDPAKRYFPSEADKVAVVDHTFVGADKTCPYCDSLLPGDQEYCTNCGAPQTESAAVKLLQTRDEDRGSNLQATQNLYQREVDEFNAKTGRPVASAQAASSNRSWVPVVAIIAVVAVIGGIIFALTRTENVVVTVTDYRWERSIEIEEVRANSGQSVCGREPRGAYDIQRREVVVDTERVQTGETCSNRQVDQGDGTFRTERVCSPVYETREIMGIRCFYNVNSWQSVRSVEATGSKNQPLEWPNTSINNAGRCTGCENNPLSESCLRCQREGDRDEDYYLIFSGEGNRTLECPVSFQMWNATPLDAGFNLDVASVGGAPRCDTLEPAG